MLGEVGEIASVSVEGVASCAAFGREHIEKERDQAVAASSVGLLLCGSCHLLCACLALEEFVLRYRHADLARLEIDEMGERKHDDVGEPRQHRDDEQKSEQARH